MPIVYDLYGTELVIIKDKVEAKLKAHEELWCGQGMRTFNWNYIRKILATEDPSFGASDLMSREHSLEVLKFIFKSNFGSTAKERVEFMKQWFDKNTGKRNTILIIGAASSGKTLLATALQRLALFVGNILNYDRNNHFSFMGATNNRLIVHDEVAWPLQAPEYISRLKEVYGGKRTYVPCKHKADQLTSGAPVIAMANSSTWHHIPGPDKDAFHKRIEEWEFNYVIPDKLMLAPSLHPCALFDLVDFYENEDNKLDW